ncbi:MAG: hypothetical protein IPL28_13275 [Chloroflexi bacterium]|nr:hypothetical protein [Chloroflexota bacterium]
MGVSPAALWGVGDEVNLAARLMSKAVVGELLVSKRVQSATAADFAFVAYSAVQFKGKAEPVPVFAVTGPHKRRAIRLPEPAYALPMVGRQAELQQIEEKLALAAQGHSQIIGIVAEAGLGKSRLVAEVVRRPPAGVCGVWRGVPVGCYQHAVPCLEKHLAGVL